MNKNQINPRLKSKLNKKRKSAIQLECFNRMMKGLHGFDRLVQQTALRAGWELMKP